jgi:YVTN family beta-propeller protein
MIRTRLVIALRGNYFQRRGDNPIMSADEGPCVSFAAKALNRQRFLGMNSESESAVTPDRLSFQAMPRQLFMVALVLLCVGVGLRSAAAQTDARAYVANSGSNDVSVIDTSTNAVIATVPVGISPSGVAITPDATRAYVTNQGGNSVSVIATATNTVTATIGVGLLPTGVAITPDGARAYVADSASNDVSVITTATNTVTATVGVGFLPVGLAITPNGAFAYVANSGSDNVSVIDTATNTVIATVFVLPVGIGPNRVAISSDGSTAYVTNSGSDNVSVIDTATNTVITNVGVGSAPMGIAITPAPSGSGGQCQNLGITANFNGDAIAANNFIWFNSVLSPSGLGATPVTIHFTHQTITSDRFNLTVSDASITFDPNATSATTTFTGGQWVTRAPSTGLAGATFLSGLAYQVPANLPGGIQNVKWSGSFSSDTPGVTLEWRWAAAVYTNFSSDNNQLQVKPVDDNKASQYQNSDHAGTPEGSYFCGASLCTFKSALIGGATGGGGSNYTGAYSGTGNATPCVEFFP